MTEKTANIQDAPAPPPNRMSRQDWILLAAIVAGALALRIIYILQYRSSPTFDEISPNFRAPAAMADSTAM